jgi:chromatin remodeling complex protein RSC6
MSSSTSTSKTNKMVKKTDAPAPAPVAAKVAAKAAPAPKVAAKKAVDTVVVPTVAAEAVADVRTADAILTTLQETLKAVSSDVTSRLRAAVQEAHSALRAMKRETRDSKRRRKVDPATLTPEQRVAWEARRANNAFLRLRPISDELCGFMGVPAKSQKSQTDVTKFIAGYVKSHNCFDPSFKRRIIPDAKLAKLLRVTDKDDVSYLNLQTYLKVHFLKA